MNSNRITMIVAVFMFYMLFLSDSDDALEKSILFLIYFFQLIYDHGEASIFKLFWRSIAGNSHPRSY